MPFTRRQIPVSENNNLLKCKPLFYYDGVQSSIKALKSELISTTSLEAVHCNPSYLSFNLPSQPGNGTGGTKEKLIMHHSRYSWNHLLLYKNCMLNCLVLIWGCCCADFIECYGLFVLHSGLSFLLKCQFEGKGRIKRFSLIIRAKVFFMVMSTPPYTSHSRLPYLNWWEC